MLLTVLACDLAKAWTARERPVDPYTTTRSLSYPSGHAAYAMALIAVRRRPRARRVMAWRCASPRSRSRSASWSSSARRASTCARTTCPTSSAGAALGAAVLSLVADRRPGRRVRPPQWGRREQPRTSRTSSPVPAGAVAFVTWITLVLSGLDSYSRLWQRIAAAFLSRLRARAFVHGGALLGGAVVWFYDSL